MINKDTDCTCKDIISGILLRHNRRVKYLELHGEIKAAIPEQQHHRIHELLEDMVRDGNVEPFVQTNEYAITSKGRDFYDNGNGGYCKQKDDANQSVNTVNVILVVGVSQGAQ